MKILFGVILFSLLTSGCTKHENMPTNTDPSITSPTTGGSTFSYLALGDSYTIGEAVKQAESFPYQLQNLLKGKNISVANPKIIAVTGWTTDELQVGIKKENLSGTYDFVTLLIGVNNQYRGYPLALTAKSSQNCYKRLSLLLAAMCVKFL
ncbi:GDSL-type esterase/lipase family protein [Pedobacter sp. HDW13]|uniref:SGNH/GDSL hydrolase family protein n=1 Tax=Pedobacter sp. HDW13 TaxID=2714940 RepID=UPI001F0D0884|nr:GDSL-type esterase/lipase family protein [Pedobacter sp. HDW13]